MHILAITTKPAFTGKIYKTDNDNDYEKSNVGKITFTVIGALDYVGNLITGEYKEDGLFKSLGSLGLGIAISLGLGEITDVYINKARRNDADSFAKTGESPKKTNKGERLGAEIGCGLGVIAALAAYGYKFVKQNPILTKEKWTPLLAIPMTGFLGLIYGVVYDAGVNKFRAKLSQTQQKKNIKES